MATEKKSGHSITVRDLAESNDYSKFAENRLGVMLLSLLTASEDPDHVAAEALVGGANDKKIDAFLINLENKSAYIGQLFISKKWGKIEAPSNKASDLNTAAAWLFSARARKLSKTVADRSIELKRLISAGEITTLNMFYCHNCIESDNVKDELETVRESVEHRLAAENLSGAQVTAVEYSLQRIQGLLESDPNKLFVKETIQIPVSAAIRESTDEWNAITATVDGAWLKELFARHQSKLFAANFRDFWAFQNAEQHRWESERRSSTSRRIFGSTTMASRFFPKN